MQNRTAVTQMSAQQVTIYSVICLCEIWRKLCNVELYIYPSTDRTVVRDGPDVESARGDAVRMQKRRGRCPSTCMDYKQVGCEKESWTCVALARVQQWTLFVTVMYLRVCWKSDIVCVTIKISSSNIFRTIC
jgi:hypothetical protein